jgi:transcriptional regulator with XRE-family HTH domain
MVTFGDRLRHERESRNTRIRDIAERTRIGLCYLEALENNDFDKLPGPRGFGKLYIRAYAEVLGFDPEPLIRAFDEEHRRRLRAGDVLPPTPRARFVPPPRKPVHLEAATPAEDPEGHREPEAATKAAAEAIQQAVAAPEPGAAAEPATAPPLADTPPDAAAEPEVAARARVPVEAETAAEPLIPAGPPATEHEFPKLKSGRIVAVALVGVALLVAVGVTLLRRSEPSPADGAFERAAPTAPSEIPGSTDPGPSGEDLDVRRQVPPPQEKEAAALVPRVVEGPAVGAAHAQLAVTEFGVGADVVDRQLVGQDVRFSEGSSVAFFTRVIGGAEGQKIHHVWLREDRVVQRIELPLGGAHWRTYSTKTLWGQGRWAVEARDADNRVLARSEFSCEVPDETD